MTASAQTTGTPPAATQSPDRVQWVDFSKGLCIVAVVSMYATGYVQGLHEAPGWMQYWVDFAKPFRMPDFFLIAGLFLSRSIDRPWRTYLDKKVVHFIYFFALWTTIYFVAEALREPYDGGRGLLLDYLGLYVEPFHMLWFIAMLPVFFLVTRLLRRVPWLIVLLAAALLQIWSPESEFRQLDRFNERYVYFYIGYIFAPHAFRLARWAADNRAQALSALSLWALINGGLVWAEMSEWPVLSLALGVYGAGAVIVTGSLASGYRWMDWLSYLGQNSIVVFLAFFFFLVAAARGLLHLDMIDDIGTQTTIVTICAIAGPLMLFRLTRHTPLKYLFKRPAIKPLKSRAASGVPTRLL